MAPIVTVPHPVLRQVAKPVEKIDKKILRIIEEMRKALLAARDPEGVGLAAPKIGVPLRIFFIRPDLKKEPRLFINPDIIRYSQRTLNPSSKNGIYEGCLSIPRHFAPIKRSSSVTIKYHVPVMQNGKWLLSKKTAVLSGFSAHIVQHETDHLNGVLFIDHVLSQNTKLFRVSGKEWEEVSL